MDAESEKANCKCCAQCSYAPHGYESNKKYALGVARTSKGARMNQGYQIGDLDSCKYPEKAGGDLDDLGVGSKQRDYLTGKDKEDRAENTHHCRADLDAGVYVLFGKVGPACAQRLTH